MSQMETDLTMGGMSAAVTIEYETKKKKTQNTLIDFNAMWTNALVDKLLNVKCQNVNGKKT